MPRVIKRLCLVICVLLFLLSAYGCSRPRQVGESNQADGEPSPQVAFEDFPRLDGSTANLPLMRELAVYYTGITAEEAELNIAVSTTDYAYHSLADGDSDLLMVYEASQATKDFLKRRDVKLEIKPIGLDALAFICNESNPVTGLTTSRIRDIYTGKITNWSEVGGEDIEIIAYQRTQLSGSQTMMEKLVMRGLAMTDAPSDLRPAAMSGLIEQIAEYNNSGNAIGYSVYYYVRNMYALPGVKTLSIDGVEPSNSSIQNGSYPFVNEFYAVIRADEPQDSLTRQVFDFLTTDDGRELIRQAGYVPVSAG